MKKGKVKRVGDGTWNRLVFKYGRMEAQLGAEWASLKAGDRRKRSAQVSAVREELIRTIFDFMKFRPRVWAKKATHECEDCGRLARWELVTDQNKSKGYFCGTCVQFALRRRGGGRPK